MRFVLGTEVAPMSVGRKGVWRIDHPGAKRDVVGFVYFDGEVLFVQSAEGADAVEIAGARIGSDWTPVEKACDVEFGGIVVRFEPPAVPEAEEHTNFYVPPVPAPPAKRAPVPAPKPDFGLDAAPDSESTRIRPLDTNSGPSAALGNG